MNLDKTVYVADSKIEADAWVASIGKSKYPASKLEVKKMRSKFIVTKKN